MTVRVDGLHKSTGERVSSSLHLVDLAGSERISKSEATGMQKSFDKPSFAVWQNGMFVVSLGKLVS